MIFSKFAAKFVARIAAIAAILCALCAGAFHLAPASAEDIPGDTSLVEPQGAPSQPAGEGSNAASALRDPPIKFKTVDYEDRGDAAGKLKLAGTAETGTPLYLFFDDQPFAKVAADSDGNWSVEGELKLDEGMHTFRAEQYDPSTRMLAGRAMVSIERAKPGADGNTQAPPGRAAMPRPASP